MLVKREGEGAGGVAQVLGSWERFGLGVARVGIGHWHAGQAQ